ncbi:bolA-like protein 3 isoform X3 [Vulpes lagopus]|uniref:bolA-like protein 3 isoform X3 n=1 Tax=Vulpes lagopus TaxID=494514 RepID=UPI001BC903BE|nr:bolA-like protein 3 isoform X3 [Vulpes lagopus]XP_041612758.1 bolA-like protein 3 isoform X3 [Vulpes lagopus]
MAAWSPAAAAPLLRGIRGQPPLVHCAQRMFASQTEGELKVTRILKEKFPGATAIKVTDISGGCGAMYEIQIESEEFKEKRTVQQHQMVNQKCVFRSLGGSSFPGRSLLSGMSHSL